MIFLKVWWIKGWILHYSNHNSVRKIQCKECQYAMFSLLCSFLCSVSSVQCSMSSVQFTVSNVLCSVCCVIRDIACPLALTHPQGQGTLRSYYTFCCKTKWGRYPRYWQTLPSPDGLLKLEKIYPFATHHLTSLFLYSIMQFEIILLLLSRIYPHVLNNRNVSII